MTFSTERLPEMDWWTRRHRANVFPHLPINAPEDLREYVMARLVAQLLDEGEVIQFEADGRVHYFVRASWANRSIDLDVNAETATVWLAGHLTSHRTVTIEDTHVPPAWLDATIQTAIRSGLEELADEIRPQRSASMPSARLIN